MKGCIRRALALAARAGQVPYVGMETIGHSPSKIKVDRSILEVT